MAPVFEHALDRLAAEHAIVAPARGVGVMRALELTIDATPVVEGALKAGLLVNRTAETSRPDAAAADGDEGGDRRGRRRFSTACSRTLQATEVTT